MEERVGKKIFNGIAIGKIKFYAKAENKVVRTKVTHVEAELARYEKAKEAAVHQLNELYEKAVVEVGETNAEIFNVHAMMLEDDDYNESVQNIITTQEVNAEYALPTLIQRFWPAPWEFLRLWVWISARTGTGKSALWTAMRASLLWIQRCLFWRAILRKRRRMMSRRNCCRL